MLLADFKQMIPGFSQKGHPEKIKLFGWYLHAHSGKDTFNPADVKKCYDSLHEIAPSSFSGYFSNLVDQKQLLKNSSGYRLAGEVRDQLTAAYTPSGHTVQVTAILLDLPTKVPDLAERTFLDETLICYKHRAFRAAIVMTWNLAYSHLLEFILAHHLTSFNARYEVVLPGKWKKGKAVPIATFDDFSMDLKESEVLEIAKSANAITNDVYKVLDSKLGRRNSAAHPSTVMIGQLQMEEFIHDLVTNVVLKLTI